MTRATAETSRYPRLAVTTLLAAVLAFVPAVPLGVALGPGATTTWCLGALVGLAGVVMGGARFGLGLGILAAVGAGLAAIAWPSPLAGALVMAVATLVPAFASRIGLHAVALFVPMGVSFLVVAPPALGSLTVADSQYPLACLALTAIGGLWATLVATVVGRRPRGVDLPAMHRDTATVYGTMLAVGVGVTAFLVLQWFPGGHGAWLIVAVLAVLRPDSRRTLHRAGERVIGVLIGLLLGIGGFLVLPLPYAAMAAGTVLVALGLPLLQLRSRYWAYEALTMSGLVLLLGSGSLEWSSIDTHVAVAVAASGVVVCLIYAGAWAMSAWRRYPML